MKIKGKNVQLSRQPHLRDSSNEIICLLHFHRLSNKLRTVMMRYKG